ncbi:uncharacterized protein LOC124326628 isoform X1 [Daphnia pulicaria]|uniref:uncharacterized protein LOC124326628 isoform X1 n=1 Tax=Daphnia pulicaria TaxID=35523 RepID=UPI001EEBE538|nr:uncharacterized protein LOC124326628 isoform X1 [Daphnia pulicaria]XP_046641503.1 uncharacterized protein LOC124326628 isoform X1 [Daphnia pulicaria]
MEFQRHDECEVNNLPCVCTCTRSAHENISANTKVMNFVLVVNGVRRWLPLLAFCDVLISVWNNCSGLWGILTHNRDRLARMSFTLEGHEKHYVKLACSGVEVGPIPSNVYLKKERPVCISIEGHGDHYKKVSYSGVEVG